MRLIQVPWAYAFTGHARHLRALDLAKRLGLDGVRVDLKSPTSMKGGPGTFDGAYYDWFYHQCADRKLYVLGQLTSGPPCNGVWRQLVSREWHENRPPKELWDHATIAYNKAIKLAWLIYESYGLDPTRYLLWQGPHEPGGVGSPRTPGGGSARVDGHRRAFWDDAFHERIEHQWVSGPIVLNTQGCRLVSPGLEYSNKEDETRTELDSAFQRRRYWSRCDLIGFQNYFVEPKAMSVEEYVSAAKAQAERRVERMRREGAPKKPFFVVEMGLPRSSRDHREKALAALAAMERVSGVEGAAWYAALEPDNLWGLERWDGREE